MAKKFFGEKIKMQFKIIPIEKKFKIHNIEKSFSKLLKIKPEINLITNLLSICCMDNNDEIVIIYNNPESKFCLYFDRQINKSFLDIIKELFSKKDIDIKIGFHLLLIAEELKLSSKLFYKILEYINFPSGEKGLDYFLSLKRFSKKLRELVLNKNISLNEAYFFHQYFLKEYDELFKIIPDNLTFTERSNIIRNITEFAKKEKKSIIEIIKLFNDLNIDKTRENIINFSNHLRYPKKSKYKEYFIKKIIELDLPKNTNISLDETFEKEDYSLNVKFNNFSSLLDKINRIKNSLEKYSSKDGFIDFFDHNNLFKDNEKDEK